MSIVHTFPGAWQPGIKETMGNFGLILTAIMIGFLVLASLLAIDGSAHAQDGKQISEASAQSNPLAVLQSFSVTDLQYALADAQAQDPPDQTSINCYTALIPIVQQANDLKGLIPKSAGLLQALRKARDAKAMLANLQSSSGPLAKINVACAALAMDT